ncbi:hypothetical protein FOA52_011092 [Chlamydomonas sp. UWO 241]|nr:hypothetical protein FOA52_011092 [Chlamydomonas sp. UWO 241]
MSATSVTVSKRALASAACEAACPTKRAKLGPSVPASVPIKGAPWAPPGGMPPPMMMQMPPMMMPPPMMMQMGCPPPFMVMHACMMIQMHMQAAMQASAGKAIQSPPADDTSCQAQPTPATLAAKALCHPEGLPTYPAFPMPTPSFTFGATPAPSAAAPAAKAMAPAAPAPAAAKPSSGAKASKASKARKAKMAAAAAAAAAASATKLTDDDFAAFIDSFVSDSEHAPSGKCEMSGRAPSGTSGMSSSLSDEFCLEDLLPADVVWAAAGGDASGAAALSESELELQELLGGRGAQDADAEEDLIFGAASGDLDAGLDAALML